MNLATGKKADKGTSANGKPRVVASFDYHDEDGKLLYRVDRFEPGFHGAKKSFPQKRADGNGGWISGLAGVRRVLYRLPQLLSAQPEQVVFIPEGEKKVDTLRYIGLVATCCPGGAEKWKAEYSEWLRGRTVVLLPDNDDPGRRHAKQVAKKLSGIARHIITVELPGLPEKGDIVDWVETPGNDQNALLKLAENAARKQGTAREAEAANRTSGRGAEFHLTEVGNAKRLVEMHGKEFRHCFPWHKDLVWDGRRWTVDDSGQVERFAKNVPLGIYQEAAATFDECQRKALAAHAIRSESAKSIKAMIQLARSEVAIPILPAELDGDVWALNCLNGTLDLKTQRLREHRREDLITKICPVEYDPEAKAPLWIATLNGIFRENAQLIQYVQRFFGHCLTGAISEHIFAIFWGTGANGKSTIINTFLELMGADYAIKASRDLFIARKHDNHPAQIARLFGKRLVVCVETHQGARLDEAFIKELTGGDPITARRMREDPWQFNPTHKALLVTNHKPEIRGTDEGIWRRPRLIPFTVRFLEEQQDKALPGKLRAEFPGILTWCVEGCLEWQREGLGMPEEVLEATREYRTEQDLLGTFLEDCCNVHRELSVQASCLYDVFRQWCERGGEEHTTQRAFGMSLRERGLEKYRGTGGSIWWKGLAVRSEISEPSEP